MIVTFTTVEKQKRLVIGAAVLTVQLSYPALPGAIASPEKKKRPRPGQKKGKKKDARRSFAEFQGRGAEAAPEKEAAATVPPELKRVFSYIERIAEDFWEEKTAPAPEKAVGETAPSGQPERRFLSLLIELTEQREDAVSFLCRVESRGRGCAAHRAFALTFSLPRGTIVSASAFADKSMLKKARDAFAQLGEGRTRRELLRDFYLRDGEVVFFKIRPSDGRRQHHRILTVTVAREKEDTG